MRVSLLSLCFLATTTFAADAPIGVAAPPSGSEVKVKPLVGKLDGLIFADDFTDLKKWHVGHGDWKSVDGHVRGATIPEQYHGGDIGHNQRFRDGIIQVVFQFDGSRTIDVNLIKNDSAGKREHVGKVSLALDSMKLLAQTGIGPTTKNIVIEEKAIKLTAGQWHAVLIEMIGTEMAVQLDTGEMIRARHELLGAEKVSFTLATNGTGAVFDEFKFWKAVPKP